MPKIKISYVDAEKIEPNPWNPNEMMEKTYEHLKREMEREGLVAPIIVRKKGDGYQVIDGEHRLKACKELGLKQVPVVVLENVTDERAKMLTLNVNHIHGADNPVRLAEVLDSLRTESDIDSILGYTDKEIEAYTELLKIPDGLPDFISNLQTDARSIIKCPKCGHEFEE